MNEIIIIMAIVGIVLWILVLRIKKNRKNYIDSYQDAMIEAESGPYCFERQEQIRAEFGIKEERSDMEQKMQDQIEGEIHEKDRLLEENDKLRDQNKRAADAIEAILTNRDLGEYESQKQGLPRMTEVDEMGRIILGEIRSNE